MRVRAPVVFFTLLATFMVGWLLVRMYAGQHLAVWTMSCILGAWSPIASAVIFQYVRVVADRESSVGVAWLVRACGMHLVLVWMLGASDWLHGPPGHASGWNSDAGAPVVLLLFAPTFALGFFASNWGLSIARRIAGVVERPAMPTELDRRPAPIRGVPFVRAGTPLARAPIAAMLVGASACALAVHAGGSLWLECGAALALALCTARNHRAIAPSVAALTALLAVSLLRGQPGGVSGFVATAVAWPWLALAGVAVYLAAVEGLLRGRVLVAATR